MPALMCEIASIVFRYAVLPNGLLEEHVIWKTLIVAEWTQNDSRRECPIRVEVISLRGFRGEQGLLQGRWVDTSRNIGFASTGFAHSSGQVCTLQYKALLFQQQS